MGMLKPFNWCDSTSAYVSVKSCQSGASMVEFIIVTPIVLFLGLSIVQLGLVYHAKSVLNYATFEAARTGAVNNAQAEPIRKELGYRMAPIFGGDGSLGKGAYAISRSAAMSQDQSITKIERLNPGPASFDLHGIAKTVKDSNQEQRNVVAIPNSHLRLRDSDVIKEDGLNVQDANLLKIRVTYGLPLKLPLLDIELPGTKSILRLLYLRSDPDNWMYYARGLLPIQATATVRMQSEAWDDTFDTTNETVFDSYYDWSIEEIDAQSAPANGSAEEQGESEGEQSESTQEEEPVEPVYLECDANGVPFENPITTFEPQVCSVTWLLSNSESHNDCELPDQ